MPTPTACSKVRLFLDSQVQPKLSKNTAQAPGYLVFISFQRPNLQYDRRIKETHPTHAYTILIYIYSVYTYIHYITLQYNTIQYITLHYIQYITLQYNTLHTYIYSSIWISNQATSGGLLGRLVHFPSFDCPEDGHRYANGETALHIAQNL